MIEIEKEKVTLPRDTWDRLRSDYYFDEIIQNILDSETILDAMENDNDFMEIREYDKLRKEQHV
ncbi:MAG TPA: hypothetical protein PK762_06255 [Candidatus Kapabacteria bacterium]|nr:hypothetical protein [Candidatus Kapabacteria bacterium]